MRERKPVKHIVLVGAGHAHVGVLLAFGRNPEPDTRLTLVTRHMHTPYSGMLPGMIAGHYTFADAHIDVSILCRFAGAELVLSEASGIDLAARRVRLAGHLPLPYDLLSLNLGSIPSTQDTPGAAEHAIPVKPIDGFLARFEAVRENILAHRARARVAVVGAGAGGVELMLSLERRLRGDARAAGFDASGLQFTIVSQSAEVLPGFPAAMRRRFTEAFARRGVEIIAGASVGHVDGGGLRFEDGGVSEFDAIFWVTQAAAAPWLGQTGLALDKRGFVAVNAALQSLSHPDVYAAGDIAAIAGHDVPKSGVYAVRQGAALTQNLRRAIQGKPLTPYRPQRHSLYLISTGHRYAIGTRNGVTMEGAWVWRLKNWLDRRFIAQFRNLPPRSVPIAGGD